MIAFPTRLLCTLFPAVLLADIRPLASPNLLLAEAGGFVSCEAEHFIAQDTTAIRAWHLVAPGRLPDVSPDADRPHLEHASGGAYLEVLPDTRQTHYEPLVVGESFSNTGGAMAVLSYRVRFVTPGRYYVWARAFSTGGEDNGLHVGLNGDWPASGLRWQIAHKGRWAWESRQRTDAEPRGERHKLFLDIPTAGDHLIQFSLREDGFEFDRWLLTTNRDFVPSDGSSPVSLAVVGQLPSAFSLPAGYVDPVDPPAAHDGSGLAMVEGDFRPGGRVTLVLNIDPAHPAPADASMDVTFTHESGVPVVKVGGHGSPDGNWRATFEPGVIGQWYFAVGFRYPDQTPVKLYNRLSGVFPVSPR